MRLAHGLAYESLREDRYIHNIYVWRIELKRPFTFTFLYSISAGLNWKKSFSISLFLICSHFWSSIFFSRTCSSFSSFGMCVFYSQVFRLLGERDSESSSSLFVSVVEIYNNNIRDLLGDISGNLEVCSKEKFRVQHVVWAVVASCT